MPEKLLLANERLLEAKRLIESVMAGMDTEVIGCPCPEHVRHYRSWQDAQTHIRLMGIADRLGREANGDSIVNLTGREAREQGLEATLR